VKTPTSVDRKAPQTAESSRIVRRVIVRDLHHQVVGRIPHDLRGGQVLRDVPNRERDESIVITTMVGRTDKTISKARESMTVSDTYWFAVISDRGTLSGPYTMVIGKNSVTEVVVFGTKAIPMRKFVNWNAGTCEILNETELSRTGPLRVSKPISADVYRFCDLLRDDDKMPVQQK